MGHKEPLTSFQVNKELLDEFKIISIRYKMPIKKLAERSMYLFVKDENFRTTILNQLSLDLQK
jgi:hypothetical protein